MISPSLLRYHMEGLSKFITILPGGWGLANLLQYYNGGGSLGTPNLYYVIYGRPLTLVIKLNSWVLCALGNVLDVVLLRQMLINKYTCTDSEIKTKHSNLY